MTMEGPLLKVELEGAMDLGAEGGERGVQKVSLGEKEASLWRECLEFLSSPCR